MEVAASDGDLVADVLRQGCPGSVAIEWQPSSGDPQAIVKAYLPAGIASRRALRSLKLALSFVPLSRPARWRRTRRLHEREWQEGWKRYFAPLRVGRRLVVKPPWAQHAARPGDVVIDIDPGLAFGTGQHPTTALCLRAIEGLARPGMRVLDLGTGSGILAIAAAKLGASWVLALDIDPQAVKAAEANVKDNGVEGVVDIQEGTLKEDTGAGQPFHLVLANLSDQTIEAMAPLLARALAPGGRLVAGGFLEDAVEELSRALGQEGLVVEQVLDEGIWRALVARQPDTAQAPGPPG